MSENRPGPVKPCPAFRAVHDPDWLYPSEGHQQASRILFHGADSRHAITLLTGERGTGKTLLLRTVAAELKDEFRVGWIDDETRGLEDPLQSVPAAFGMNVDRMPVDERVTRMRRVLEDSERRGQPAILIVDDAHLLSDEALDELRQLADFRADGTALMPLLMAGETGLRGRLTEPQNRALYRRIGGHVDLPPLTPEETGPYIAHRFQVAGCECHAGVSPFEAGSFGVLHHWSNGVPGVLNEMIGRCLTEAQRTRPRKLGVAFVEGCLREMSLQRRLDAEPPRPSRPAPRPAAPVVDMPVRDEVSAAPPEPVAAETETPAQPVVPAAIPAPSPSSSRNLPVPVPRPAAPADPPPPRWGVRIASLLVLGALAGGLYWWQFRGDGPDETMASLGIADESFASRGVSEPVAARPATPSPVTRVGAAPDPGALLNEALQAGRRNPELATLLYERSALRGNPRAAYYLGQAFETGDGVAIDANRARSWYLAAGDIWGAKARLGDLGSRMIGQGAASAPVPLMQAVLPSGEVELHWRAAEGESPAGFAVEYVTEGGDDQVRRVETDRSAILLEGPLSSWRIITLNPDGRDGGATAWASPPP